MIGGALTAELPALAGEAPLLQRQLRPCAGPAAGRPAGRTPGAPRVPGIRPLHGRADAPPLPAARRAGERHRGGRHRPDRRRLGRVRAPDDRVCRARRQQRGGRRGHRQSRLSRPTSSPTTPPSRRSSRSCASSASRGGSTSSRGATCASCSPCCAARRSSPSSWTGATAATGSPSGCSASWTTLPAGPATLAAKTGALLAPMAIRRTPAGKFRIEAPEAFLVPSSDPADLQRATQRIADALEATIRAAPSQWYSFKPIWPSDPVEAAELEARAAAMLAGRAAPAPDRGRRPRDRTGGAGGGPARAPGPCAGPLLVGRRPPARRAARGPAARRVRQHRRALVPDRPGAGRPGAGEPAPRLRGPRGPGPRHAARAARGHRPGGPGAAGPALLPPRRPVLPRGRPRRRVRRRHGDREGGRGDAGRGPRRAHVRPAGDPRGHALRGHRAAGRLHRPPRRAPRHGAHGGHRGPGDPALAGRDAGPRRRQHRAAQGRPTGPAGGDAPRRVGGHGQRSGRHRGRAPGPAVRPPGTHPARGGPAGDRDGRAGVRRLVPPDRGRPVRGTAARRARRPEDGTKRGADDGADGEHRRGLRDPHRGRPGAVVGRHAPDLAGPRAGPARRPAA